MILSVIVLSVQLELKVRFHDILPFFDLPDKPGCRVHHLNAASSGPLPYANLPDTILSYVPSYHLPVYPILMPVYPIIKTIETLGQGREKKKTNSFDIGIYRLQNISFDYENRKKCFSRNSIEFLKVSKKLNK